MEAFYRILIDTPPGGELGTQEGKARALRAAQQRLKDDSQFEHPFHWSPFVLMGDWQ